MAFEAGPEGFGPVILRLGKARLPSCPGIFATREWTFSWRSPWVITTGCSVSCCLVATGPESFSETQTEIAQEVGEIISLALAHTELLENVTRSRGQLESLSHKLILVREEESRRIARELHDEIGQILAVLNLNLTAIKKGAGRRVGREAVDGCLDLVARLITKVRGLSLDLHPSLLDDFGVVTALRRHVESLAERTGLDLRFQADQEIGRLGMELETVCYRVVQEAVTNALRHAEPGHRPDPAATLTASSNFRFPTMDTASTPRPRWSGRPGGEAWACSA